MLLSSAPSAWWCSAETVQKCNSGLELQGWKISMLKRVYSKRTVVTDARPSLHFSPLASVISLQEEQNN